MKKLLKFKPSRKIFLPMACVLFLLGLALAVRTSVWSRRAIYTEHDKHLSEICGMVDYNITIVLDECRNGLSQMVESESFQKAESALQSGGELKPLAEAVRNSAIFLSDYVNRIVAFRNGEPVFSTAENDSFAYSIHPDDDGDDVWIITDSQSEESYICLSLSSETDELVYCLFIDLEPFFTRVAVDTVYEEHWIVLYEGECGLILKNDNQEPEQQFMSAEEILARDDGYTRILAQEQNNETGASTYQYTDKDGNEQKIRIYVINSASSKNQIFTVAAAVYNDTIYAPLKRMSRNSLIAALLMAFSAAAGGFMLLHGGKRERELADELASIEKEKELSDQLLKNQEQLVHHQRLEMIGTLTAGIAHEFNNLLSPIMGNSLLILEKSRTASPEIFDNALEIYQASDKAKELVLQISKLSRKKYVMQMSVVYPEKLISDVLAMSAASVPSNIVVQKEIRTDCLILGDADQLCHMLLNLVINAIHAMKPDGGFLTLAAESDSECVYISVADTGKGIPPADINAIFDPFFTTKEIGEGTGLGLSIAQHTAMNHGGKITAENLPDGGAKFTFITDIYRP